VSERTGMLGTAARRSIGTLPVNLCQSVAM